MDRLEKKYVKLSLEKNEKFIFIIFTKPM